MKSAWREFRKMRLWGQVLIAGATALAVVVAIAAISGEDKNNNNTTASDGQVLPASSRSQRCATALMITTPHHGSTVYSRSIRVRGRTDAGAKFMIKGWVRNSPVDQREGIARSDGTFAGKIRVDPGDNEIEVDSVRKPCDPVHRTTQVARPPPDRKGTKARTPPAPSSSSSAESP